MSTYIRIIGEVELGRTVVAAIRAGSLYESPVLEYDNGPLEHSVVLWLRQGERSIRQNHHRNYLVR